MEEEELGHAAGDKEEELGHCGMEEEDLAAHAMGQVASAQSQGGDGGAVLESFE